jgi:hypothetical protein
MKREPSRTAARVPSSLHSVTTTLVAACLAGSLGACTTTSGRGAGAPWGGQVANEAPAEVYRPAAARQPSKALLKLPGAPTSQLVAYDVVDGMAVMEGDILLGPASQVPLRYGPSLFGGQSGSQGGFHAVTTNDTSHLWPGGSIPYVIDGSVSPSTVSSIQWAIAEAGTTAIKLRPRLATDQDFVVFSDTGDGCTSFVGRIGGPQTISVTGCGRGSVLHEILHAAGFFHEQSRGDRDDFITIVWSEIEPSQKSAFETRPGVSRDVGAYDYGSIMHYGTHAFSRTGQPTIIPRTPGVTIGQRDGLSPSDRAAVATLYGAGGGVPSFPGVPTGPTQPPAPGAPSWWPFPTDGTVPPLPAALPQLPAGLPQLPAGLPELPTSLPAGLPTGLPTTLPELPPLPLP